MLDWPSLLSDVKVPEYPVLPPDVLAYDLYFNILVFAPPDSAHWDNIIVGVDDRLESPDTIALRYEEAARAENGGDPRGDSPPRLLEMATYTKAQLPSMHGK